MENKFRDYAMPPQYTISRQEYEDFIAERDMLHDQIEEDKKLAAVENHVYEHLIAAGDGKDIKDLTIAMVAIRKLRMKIAAYSDT